MTLAPMLSARRRRALDREAPRRPDGFGRRLARFAEGLLERGSSGKDALPTT